jgi:hypothetical protein
MEGETVSANGAEAAKPGTDPRRVTLAFVGAIGTGISGVGFFIFVGGALLLARFTGAGLPSVVAVATVPRTQLLVVGAAALTILLTLGLAAVLILSSIWPLIRSQRVRLGLLAGLGTVGVLVLLYRIELQYLGEVGHRLLLISGVLVVVAGTGLAYRLGEQGLADARATGDRARLLGFAACTLVTFAVYSAFIVYARQLNHPQMQAVAVIPAQGAPLIGLYVGETAGQNSPNPNRLYVGVVPVRRGGESGLRSAGRVIGLQSQAVAAYAIGPSEPLPEALARGPRLLRELQRRRGGTVR